MERQFDFKRKIYDELIKWKSESNRVSLIVDGLRQIGKSYIVNKFAHENYENVIIYDFRHNKSLRKIFDGDLDVDTIIRKSMPYFLNENFIPNKTILIFKEIGDCPFARTALKSFALDKRYDVIATGSLLGTLNYRRKEKIDIPTGYEKIIEMTSLDFEEFLCAIGVNEKNIEVLKGFSRKREEIPESLAEFYKEALKKYIIIGGMPESIKEFLKTNNYLNSRKYLESLIADYRSDFGRFINSRNEEEIDYRLQSQLNLIFDSIPAQLAREKDTSKFKFSEIKKGGRSTEFEKPFEWLEKAGLVLRCFNLKAIERPFEGNADKTYFKAFIADSGVFMAMYPLSVTQDFLKGELDSKKGAVYENLVATMINKSNFPLYYFSNGTQHLEIDFIIEGADGIILLEEKSTNEKMAASRSVMEGKTPYKAKECYKIINSNFGKRDFYISIPQYAFSFLLKEFPEKQNVLIPFKEIKYPDIS